MDYSAARARLIEHLSDRVHDRRVLDVMSCIPRELFVPTDARDFAYSDRPLPIGMDQTISQPYIIALMTSALELTGKEKVLELGTGSGYQAAILAELSDSVVTVERLLALAEKASLLLSGMGYKNITVHQAIETLGWPPSAPYDAIIVTAAAPEIPEQLLDQLLEGGKMVIPVGSRYFQELLKITRGRKQNNIVSLGNCQFVPLIGKGAWEIN